MPMAEIADAIVSLARATLENAIDVINKHPDWGARVVYGDTGMDSWACKHCEVMWRRGRQGGGVHAVGPMLRALTLPRVVKYD